MYGFQTFIRINPLELTKQDILSYLNNLRKPSTKDPSNKWIGTYNGRQMILLKFFKWLYYPGDDYRKRSTPACMQGIRKLKEGKNIVQAF